MADVVRCVYCRRRLADASAVCPTCGKQHPEIEEDGSEMTESRARRGQHEMAARDDYDDYDDDEEDFDADIRKRSVRKSRSSPPGKVQAIAIMTLVGGIYALLFMLGAVGGSALICCLWPGVYYGLVLGVLAIIKGSQLLGQEAHLQAPPRGTAIMMIINIINLDVVNLVLGILILVFLSDPEVEEYYRG